MKKIDFAIIGAQKSGTTALFDMLKQHPDICFPLKKEDMFFVRDDLYNEGGSYLDKVYGEGGDKGVIGYSYVNLMYFYQVSAPRLYDNNPGMKLVCVLRDPVKRAYSAYNFMRSRGVEECGSFEDALRRERECADSPDFIFNANFTYLKHGIYADQLSDFISRFGRDSLRVYTQEELKQNYRAVCSDIFHFLGVVDVSDSLEERVSNKTGRPASRMVSRIVYADSPVKRLYKMLFPERLRALIRTALVARIKRLNIRDTGYDRISPETEAYLRGFFGPHNKRLESLIGRKIDW